LAKVKVRNKRLGSDLVGASFRNITSETVFTFGRFTVDTNFGVRNVRNYSNTLSSFVKPITLESLNITDDESEVIYNSTQEVALNFDKTDLTSYARFGSLREILRVSVENIILEFPASIRVTSQISTFTNSNSVVDYVYDPSLDVSSFIIPFNTLVNKFGLVINSTNNQLPQDQALRNLNISYNEYLIWREDTPDENTLEILGFTGFSTSKQYISVVVKGDPFPELSSGGTTAGKFKYHLKPKPLHFNKFKSNLSRLESYLLNEKIAKGYRTEFQSPIQLEDGGVTYSDQEIIWSASDGYNVDIDGYNYDVFLSELGAIGTLYDQFKSDLLIRMLVPESLIEGDNTESQKMSKLLRIYGRSFDNVKLFIDALVTINKLSYNKKKNIPDLLVKNLAKTMGWDAVTLVNDDDLLNSFFSTEQRSVNDLLPPEVDVELWRRILLNTNYLFKAKGTRDAIKTMLLMVGIPEPFINITEYIYTVDEKINPNTVTVSLADLPSASLPYNSEGYPIAPKETKTFYFQVSGSTDSGQQYMDVFRDVGFRLNRKVDNKKSWVQSGTTERRHYTTPNYYQNDSNLVLNTKEVDITLDISRGIEFDVWNYNLEHNFPITTSGVTKPYLYINIPFTYGASASSFTIPEVPQGDIQVSFNGLTLTKGSGSTDPSADYYINPLDSKEAILIGGTAQSYTNGHKDVITLTYLNDKSTGGTYNQVDYVVTKITANPDGLSIPLLEDPLGEVQLVVNGMTLTKGNSLYTGDYVINSGEIIVVNNDLKNYLIANPVVVISYIKSSGNDPILKKSESHRIDSFSTSKFFYNSGINKYIYVMDYEPPNVDAIKVVINGLTLQNGKDFTLNSSNRKQILFNTSALNIGYLINVFYITADGSTDTGINFGDFEFPNLSEISFLEYLELINRRLINVKNRKTLTDHEGGLYPTVQKLYEEYLKRSNHPTVRSNGYTFTNVYPFINKFNSFFHRFIDQLLSATIILKKGGVLVRNTAFTKQKFPYRRGVSFDQSLNHLGNDGSEFVRRVQDTTFSFAWDDIICVQQEYVINEYEFFMTEIERVYSSGATTGNRNADIFLEYEIAITPSLSNGTIFTLGFDLGQIATVEGDSDASNLVEIIKNGSVIYSNEVTDGTENNSSSFTMLSSDSLTIQITMSAHSPNSSDDASTSLTLNINTITASDSGAIIDAPLPFSVNEAITIPAGSIPSFWAADYFGYTTNESAYRSIDSGLNFTSVNTQTTIDSVGYSHVSFVGQVGIMGATISTSNATFPHIITTNDGGATWTSRRPALNSAGYNGGGIKAVLALNSNVLCAVGANGFLKSTDGGVTWSRSELVIGAVSQAVNGIHFKDLNIGYAIGYHGFNSGYQGVYKTTNGGTTWTKILATPVGQPKALSFAPSNNVAYFTHSTSTDNVLYKSIDGGDTWTDISANLPADGFGVNQVWAIDDNIVFVIMSYTGNDAKILRSTDGGTTWTAVNTLGRAYSALYFIDENIGVASGHLIIDPSTSNNGYFRTTDGGTTWTFIDQPTGQLFINFSGERTPITS